MQSSPPAQQVVKRQQGQSQKQVKRQQGQSPPAQKQVKRQQVQQIKSTSPTKSQQVQVQQRKQQTTNIIKPVGQLPQPQQQTNPVNYVLKTIIDFILDNKDPKQQRAGVDDILDGAKKSYSKQEMQKLNKIVNIMYST